MLDRTSYFLGFDQLRPVELSLYHQLFFYVPSSEQIMDQHFYFDYNVKFCFQSEFIAECFMRRAYLTGFTGSAGTAVVTKDKAAFWTDGRYFLQVPILRLLYQLYQVDTVQYMQDLAVRWWDFLCTSANSKIINAKHEDSFINFLSLSRGRTRKLRFCGLYE